MSRRRGRQDIDRLGPTLWRGELALRVCRPIAAGAFACHRESDLLDDPFALRRLTQNEKVRPWRNW
jgi:hypothetical protein